LSFADEVDHAGVRSELRIQITPIERLLAKDHLLMIDRDDAHARMHTALAINCPRPSTFLCDQLAAPSLVVVYLLAIMVLILHCR
jgi:hypothetical protein